MSNKKNLIDLNVEKYDHVNQAVVTGEANGSFVRKVLKKIDTCDFVWTNTDKNNVSKNIGLISGSIPIILIGSIGSILNSALIKPLGRVIGFKGIRCKKRKDDDECCDEDEDLDNCSDECGNEDEDIDEGMRSNRGRSALRSDQDDSDEDDSDEDDSDEDDSDEVDSDEDDSDEVDSDEVDSDEVDSGSSSNNEDDSDEEEDYKKKKKNWFGSAWDKIRNKKP